MIYKFQPFSSSKELGKEYNAHCALVPNPEDWILILDYDCMVLNPGAYKLMELAIERYPETEVFTAVTNRVGYRTQCYKHKLNKETDLRPHLELAEQLSWQYATGEAVPVVTAAGFFLLFQKKYWIENPFQQDIINVNGRIFDVIFCRSAQQRASIRMIKGVYCWHTYRVRNKGTHNNSHLWLKKDM